MDIDPRSKPSVDINEARRLFAIAESDESFDSWLAKRVKMAFYQTPHGGLLVRGFSLAERPWSKIFRDEGLVGTLVASYWDAHWPDPTTDERDDDDEDDIDDDDIDEEPGWRPADIEISGLDGTFRGEIQDRGNGEIVRFTAEVTSLIADAFASKSDEQMEELDPDDTIFDRWDSEKYGSFLPRPIFTPGKFHVVTGDDDWDSVFPDEDGMYRLRFDGFSWGEVEPPRSIE
jgi:hypothetical protein